MPCLLRSSWLLLVGLSGVLAACHGSTPSPPPSDLPDSGVPSDPIPDAGSDSPDSGVPDSGSPWTIRQRPLECLDSVQGMVFGHDTFVSVGDTGEICHSSDGRTWKHIAQLDAHLRAITFGQGVFVAVGTGGINNSNGAQLFSSPDGVTWTRHVPEIFGNELVDVTFGGALFVAVGGNSGTHQGSIVTSPDGVAWTPRADTLGSYHSSVIHAAGLFITGALTSPDGITWTLHGDVSSIPKRVAFGANTFVGLSDTSVMTSSDGLHWGAQTTISSVPLHALAFDGSHFIAAGEKGTVLVSTDAVTWTPTSVPSFADLGAIIVTDGARLVAGAGHFLSTDAMGWQDTEAIPRSLNGVAKGGALFAAVGANGAILTSPDGATWTRRDSGTYEDLNQVRFVGGRFIAVGSAGSVIVSSDGEQWQRQSSGVTVSLTDVGWDGTQFAVVGATGATSPDGLTWTPVSQDAVYVPQAMTYGASQWIGVHPWGYPRDAHGLIYVANTFGQWQLLSGVAPSPPLRDVHFAHGQFVAVANGGIYTSVDGVAWTYFPSEGVQWLSISSHDSGFFLLGQSFVPPRPVSASSVDGTNWSIEDSKLPVLLSRAVSDGTRAVAVGPGGVIATRP